MRLDKRVAPALSGKRMVFSKLSPYFCLNKFQKGVRPRYFRYVDLNDIRTSRTGKQYIQEDGNIVEVDFPGQPIEGRPVMTSFRGIRESAEYADGDEKRTWLKKWYTGKVSLDSPAVVPIWVKDEGLVDTEVKETYIDITKGVYNQLENGAKGESIRAGTKLGIEDCQYMFQYNSREENPEVPLTEIYSMVCVGTAPATIKDLAEAMETI